MTESSFDAKREKGATPRLRETILRLLEKRPTASTLELAILTGKSAADCRDVLQKLEGQGRCAKCGQASFAIWKATGTAKHEQLSEFRKPEKVL